MNLKKIMKSRGLNQQEVANSLEIPRNTVWRWCNNKATPSVEMLQKISELFNISTDELLNGPNEESREFKLILDKEGKVEMNMINISANSPEQRAMIVTREKIGAIININTRSMTKEDAKKLFFSEISDVFEDAWERQEKWRTEKKD